jgi:hypothetical protein
MEGCGLWTFVFMLKFKTSNIGKELIEYIRISSSLGAILS